MGDKHKPKRKKKIKVIQEPVTTDQPPQIVERKKTGTTREK
jgi:hypothetical protein